MTMTMLMCYESCDCYDDDDDGGDDGVDGDDDGDGDHDDDGGDDGYNDGVEGDDGDDIYIMMKCMSVVTDLSPAPVLSPLSEPEHHFIILLIINNCTFCIS